MSAVSLLEDEERRRQEAHAPILQGPPCPVRIERLQGINWRDICQGREKPRLRVWQRFLIRHHGRMREQLSNLSERLALAGERIHQRVGEIEQRLQQIRQQSIEREQRRVERAKTPLGRLAERLEAAGWTPPPLRR
jgi:hypothetical protein